MRIACILIAVLLQAVCSGQIFFQEAPTVTTNDSPNSAVYNKLVQAFRDRIESGLGDGAWRIVASAHAFCRQFRGGDIFTSPAWDEWWEAFCHVPRGSGSWGEFGGDLNEAQPVVQFVYGWGAGTSDAERLNAIPAVAGNTPEACWEAAKAQRGAVLDDGSMYAPAFQQARKWRTIRKTMQGVEGWPYLSTTGNFLPSSKTLVGVSKVQFITQPPLASSTVDYPDGTTVVTWPDYYAVTPPGVSTVRLLRRDYYWLKAAAENNVTGLPGLGYFDGDNPQALGHGLDWIIQWWLSGFVGSASQTSDETRRIKQIAFDFDTFFRWQYRAAPARGTLSGTNIVPAYPRIESEADHWATGTEVGTVDAHGGFTLAGARVWGVGTGGSVFVEIGSGTNSLQKLQIGGGITNKVVWFPSNGVDSIWFKITKGRTNSSTGSVGCEIAELVAMQPELDDAYALLRIKCGNVMGDEVVNPTAISSEYFNLGCIANGTTLEDPEYLNESVFVEAMRLKIRENIRVIKRWSNESHSRPSLQGYGLDEEGRSVLMFEPNYYIGGTEFEMFDGIIGSSCDAPTNGFDTNWVMFITGCNYAPAGTGLEEDTYSDTLPFLHNRTLMMHPNLYPMQDGWPVRWLGDVSARMNWENAPEAFLVELPSRFNYSLGSNIGDTNFYRHNEVYPKPYKVISATLGEGLVRITLDRRLATSTTGARSDENLIEDYLNRNLQDCPLRVGDIASGLEGSPNPSSLKGACIPRFFFVRMPPKVYEDNNQTNNPTDTRVFASGFQWMGFCLAAMCEGFSDVNGHCSPPGCFTFESLMQRATQIGRMQLLPKNANLAECIGPMPNTRLEKEPFNRVASAVNLLVNVPIDVGNGVLEMRELYTYAEQHGAKELRACDGANCTTPTSVCGSIVIHNIINGLPAWQSVSAWTDDPENTILPFFGAGGSAAGTQYGGISRNCSSNTAWAYVEYLGMDVKIGIKDEDLLTLREELRGPARDGTLFFVQEEARRSYCSTSTPPEGATDVHDVFGGMSCFDCLPGFKEWIIIDAPVCYMMTNTVNDPNGSYWRIEPEVHGGASINDGGQLGGPSSVSHMTIFPVANIHCILTNR